MSEPSPALNLDAPRLPISSAHVRQQFARRGDLSAARFLHDEIGERLAGRLRVMRLTPGRILDAGCGMGDDLARLRAHYPAAAYTGLDHCPPLLARAAQAAVVRQAWWRTAYEKMGGKLSGKPVQTPSRPTFVLADLAQTGLPAQSQNLVWSNLALHWHPAPHAVLAEWRRVLAAGGLAFFSCLGPGSLRELRAALDKARLATATPGFVDMHDLGDALLHAGYADPVMEQETLTLTYRSPQQLLADVRALGGNPAEHRRAGLAGRAWLARLHQALAAQRNAAGLIPLTLEVTYGHAWRAATRQAAPGEVRLDVSAIGRARAR